MRRAGARVWFFAATVHVLTRLGAEELKPVLGRLRPSQWAPHGGPMFFQHGVSFPSGYAAYYFGIVAPFAVAWPRVGIPLLVVPCFVAWSRVAVDAHFVSDVVAAAAMVGFVTWIFALGFRIDGRSRWRR
jgi:membrane-associated phospholipid phosphatase